jgi:hypothetical protein
VIEQAPRSASAPVAAVPVIMRVSGIAIPRRPMAEMMSAVAVVVSMVVVALMSVILKSVVSMSVMHVISF